MQPSSYEQLLERAAAECGIGAGFWDIWGRRHETSVETKRALLGAMGIPAADSGELAGALAARAHREWERLCPPAVLATEGDSFELPLHIFAENRPEYVRLTIRREDGETSSHEISFREMKQIASVELDGHTCLRFEARVPVELPLGYHDVAVEAAGRQSETRYIVTPRRAWTHPHLADGGKAAGIAVSLYGVRSARNWGSGDFTDLRAIIDWVADELGASFVALNPLHAIHNRRPFNTSPYLPNSIFYRNFLYLDVEAIEDFAGNRRAHCLRRSPGVIREIEELRRTEFVEYERVAALKLRFLKLLFAQFLRERRRGSQRSEDFDAYCEREGELLEKFSLFCALDQWLHGKNPDLWVWTDWPAEYHNPESEACRTFRRKHWRAVMFVQYLQWQIDRQLQCAQEHTRHCGMAIGLYHDLALATDRFGSDLWAHRRFYVPRCRVGSPPDDFSPQGQDWAFPPPNSMAHREDGYRLVAESIRKNCRPGGALRIDHVMRLFRLYWIPDGISAVAGAYVRERSDDLVRILALESVRNQVLVVGEDLGTVETEVRESLARFGILSYRLLYFEKREDGHFRGSREYPRQALVSSTTHDLPTLSGFWSGADIIARRSAGTINDEGARAQSEARLVDKQRLLDVLFEQSLMPSHLPRHAAAYGELTGELHNAIVGFLAVTPSQLLAINHEDLTKEPHQQNLPGTTWQYPNWGRKMRYTVEELRTSEEARQYTAMFRNWIIRSGRENHSSESSRTASPLVE
jgi:4-alpha-glucanotransferase